jgi:hypothetical protein
MKTSLRHVPNKLGYNGVTRAKLKQQGAVPFETLSRLLTTGETDVMLLDLTGNSKPIGADIVSPRKLKRKTRSEKLTKFERTLRSFMEANDIDPEEVTGLALIMGEEHQVLARPVRYKPITLKKT